MAPHNGTLVFYVNGKKVVDSAPDPDLTLLQYLREKPVHLPGTKLSCGEGGCGACTVMLSRYDRDAGKPVHRAVMACLVPLCQVHGRAVTTVEGVGSLRSGLHPVQDRLVKGHGIQCGFCTPGMVMSMYALLRTTSTPTRDEIETALAGNLCRCTGYRPILQAFDSFSEEYACELGEMCCKNKKKTQLENDITTEYVPYDPSQEPIFPSELQVSDEYDKTSLMFEGPTSIWSRPTSLKELLQLKKTYPSGVYVAGFTKSKFTLKDSTSEIKNVLISIDNVPELHVKERSSSGLTLGAGITLTEAINELLKVTNNIKGDSDSGFNAVLTLFQRVAGKQVKNAATLGGSLLCKNGNSDVIVALVAAGAVIKLADTANREPTCIKIKDWFSENTYKPPEDTIILDITIPFTSPNEHVVVFKQSKRRTNDRAVVNAGFRVVLRETDNEVETIALCFGGLGPDVLMATRTAEYMSGRPWKEATIEQSYRELLGEFNGYGLSKKEDYRLVICLGFFFKFLIGVAQKLHGDNEGEAAKVHKTVSVCQRPPRSAIQVWEKVTNDQVVDTIGQPEPHVAAKQQATGEAEYSSDIPIRKDELYLGLVRSTKAHARILSVDASAALSMPGVVGLVDHQDVPGSNLTGHFNDELVFAIDEVECMGQIICGIVAETEQEARRAAKEVKVAYEELPFITTIEEAIQEESFFKCGEIKVSEGNVSEAFESSDQTMEGTVRNGSQEHFYMEPQFALILPKREGDFDIYAGCQDPQLAQKAVADALNIPRSKVVIHTKRIGGGFGGKLSRPILTLVTVPAAVAAYKFQRSVRCNHTREEDITTTGGRHPYLVKYKVGFNNDGQINAVEYKMFSNAGSVVEESPWVADFCVSESDGPYNTQNIKVEFQCCKTNLPSPTAFRGYGMPQSVFANEGMIDDVAEALNILPEELRTINLYKDGERNVLRGCTMDDKLQRCWYQLLEEHDVAGKRREQEKFNKENQWKKRGLAVIPCKVPILAPSLSLTQGAALVHVYLDGTVLLTHGGVEIGQGIHTKMIQIASRELGITVDSIHIAETATNTVPNSTPTYCGTTTDIYAPAVIDACQKLRERLSPFKKAEPNASWKSWVNAAYEERVSLSATGFSAPKVDKNEAKPLNTFNYYVFGAACSLVEVDCLTGEHVVLETDIVMDVGRSLNPGIDIGQIEGAFMQGLGMHTMEELVYNSEGYMTTRGPDTYKIPSVSDIPVNLNVTLLKDSDNPKAVYSSKGVGEPAIVLGSAVIYAIKDAIRTARKERGLKGRFRLDSPATVERIRMAFSDKFTDMVAHKDMVMPETKSEKSEN